MSVLPIGHLEFTRADIHVLLNRGCELVDRGLAGACVPVETEAGELVIALLDYDHQCLICAIGKAQGWYYALDAAWQPLAQGKFIDDVLAVLPGALEAHRPAAANAC
ncbi:MAG: hypothetical protein RLN99_03485 [Kiloniellaceae bacterium]|uniref:hypothetical protein n=1 Tax=Pelagibius sp. 7325 TaxID=3131994 RepID=UPI0030EF9E20